MIAMRRRGDFDAGASGGGCADVRGSWSWSWSCGSVTGRGLG